VPDQPIPLTHPLIKGVPRAHNKGAALVSFNESAFCSYGKRQNANAPISERAAFAYTTALNHLLRRDGKQKLQLGETTVIVWADEPGPGELALMRVFSSEDTDAVCEQLQRIARGVWAEDPTLDTEVRFYVLGLAPNIGRLRIRFFLTDTLGFFLSRVQQHCQDLLFTPPGVGVQVPSLAALARATFPYDAATKRYRINDQGWKRLNRLTADLVRAVLTGQPYPSALLGVVLGRLRHDRHLTRERAGLIKAIINRMRRSAHPPAEEFGMALAPDHRDPGYLIGRLFAVLECIQRASRAPKSSQPTLYDRYGPAGSTAPGMIIPTVLRLSMAHLKKAKREDPARAYWLDKRAENIIQVLGGTDHIPRQLSLEQQGAFFIGYYHERAVSCGRNKSNADTTTDQVPENTED
jgi:CRISPR-associated protein Csd1